MLDKTKDISVSAQAWLDEFERTLGSPLAAPLASLIRPHSTTSSSPTVSGATCWR